MSKFIATLSSLALVTVGSLGAWAATAEYVPTSRESCLMQAINTDAVNKYPEGVKKVCGLDSEITPNSKTECGNVCPTGLEGQPEQEIECQSIYWFKSADPFTFECDGKMIVLPKDFNGVVLPPPFVGQ